MSWFCALLFAKVQKATALASESESALRLLMWKLLPVNQAPLALEFVVGGACSTPATTKPKTAPFPFHIGPQVCTQAPLLLAYLPGGPDLICTKLTRAERSNVGVRGVWNSF